MAAPAGYSSLGLVGFTDMGNYNAQLSYMKNDLTHSSGKLWRSKVDDNVGHTPEEGAYWTLWIDAPENLSELQDVYIYNPANGDILSYNATLGQWTKSDALGKEVNIRARLGAHNINKSEQTFTINNTTSPKRFYVGGVSDLKQSEQLTISFDVSAVSGYSGSNALRVDMVANSLVSPLDDCGVSVTHYEKSISVFNDVELTDTNVYFELRIPAGESSSATVTISNLLIKFANDASNEVTPFAESNEVLTEKVASVGSEVNSVKTTLTNQINISGVKNALPYPYAYKTKGVITVNLDGSLTLNGTTGSSLTSNPFVEHDDFIKEYRGKTVIVSMVGIIDDGMYMPFTIYDSSNTEILRQDLNYANPTREITVPSNADNANFGFYLQANKTYSSKTLLPMFSLKEVYTLDSTWEPPAKTNRQLTQDSITWEDEAQIGAVNGCPNGATTQTTGGGGVTLTVNADKSMTFSGTATAAANIELGNISDFYKGKALKMYSGAKTTDAYMYLQYTQGGSTKYITEDYFTIPTDATDVKAFVHVNSTGDFTTPVTVYPMFTLPDYNGPYVPYAKTNKELTEDVATNASAIASVKSGVLNINPIEVTENTPTTIISSAGVYLISITGGAPSYDAFCFASVHGSWAGGSLVQKLFESTPNMHTFDISTAGVVKLTSTQPVRVRLIKLSAGNY